MFPGTLLATLLELVRGCVSARLPKIHSTNYETTYCSCKLIMTFSSDLPENIASMVVVMSVQVYLSIDNRHRSHLINCLETSNSLLMTSHKYDASMMHKYVKLRQSHQRMQQFYTFTHVHVCVYIQ